MILNQAGAVEILGVRAVGWQRLHAAPVRPVLVPDDGVRIPGVHEA